MFCRTFRLSRREPSTEGMILTDRASTQANKITRELRMSRLKRWLLRGLLLSAVFSFIGAVIYLMRGSAYWWKHTGVSPLEMLLVNFTAVPAGAVVVGLLVPWATTKWRAFLMGTAGMLPVGLMYLGLVMDVSDWFPAGLVISFVGSAVVGGGVALVSFDDL